MQSPFIKVASKTTVGSKARAEKDAARKKLKASKYGPVVRVNGITKSMNQHDVIEKFKRYGSVEYYFFGWEDAGPWNGLVVQFATQEQATDCHAHFSKNPIIFPGQSPIDVRRIRGKGGP